MSMFLAVCRITLYVVLHCEDNFQTTTTTSSDSACLDLFPLVNSSTLNFSFISYQLPCMLILYVSHSCLKLSDLNSLQVILLTAKSSLFTQTVKPSVHYSLGESHVWLLMTLSRLGGIVLHDEGVGAS